METEKVGPISNWPLPICTLAGRGIRFNHCWGCTSTPDANNAHSITARIVRTIRSPIALWSDDYEDITKCEHSRTVDALQTADRPICGKGCQHPGCAAFRRTPDSSPGVSTPGGLAR